MVRLRGGRGKSVARAVGAAACLALLATGCQTTGCHAPPAGRASPRELDVPKVKTRDDITAVYSIFPRDPWLRDNDGNVIGFKVSVYFQSGQTQKGAFVPGKILIWLYSMRREPDGQLERQFVRGWEMDEQEAMSWRVRFERKLGHQYGFPVLWPRDADLAGKQIEIQFGYERKDGKIIEGSVRRFRVPVPAGYRPPALESLHHEPQSEAPQPTAQPGRTR